MVSALCWQNFGFFKKNQPSKFCLVFWFLLIFILLLFKLFLRHFTKKEAIKVTNKVRNGK